MKTNLLQLLALLCLSPLICEAQVNFSSSLLNVGQSSSQRVATGDFNGDGNADVAASNSQRITILIGNGSGGFVTRETIVISDYINEITTNDFNGDGKSDLAIAAASDSAWVFMSNASNGFAAARKFAVASFPNTIVTGDFNGDGKKDLATFSFGSDNVSVLLGNGTNGFAQAEKFAIADGAEIITAGDFNGDGRTDLAVSNYSNNTVITLLSDRAGGFVALAPCAVGKHPYYLINSDVNGDGKLDLIVPQDTSISILLGNGTGQFSLSSEFAFNEVFSKIAVADFNGDRKADIAISNYYLSNTVSIFLGDGTGHFTAGIGFTIQNLFPSDIITGDFNRDGKNDLIIGDASSGENSTVALLINATPAPTAGLPVITGFTPATGPIDYSVVITGNNFGGATSVKFNNTPVPFVLSSPTQIRAQVPTGASSGRISIAKLSGTTTSLANFIIGLPAPINLQARVISGSRIGLSWTKTLLGSAYIVEEAITAEGTYTVLATLEPDSEGYIHQGLMLGTTHYYRVKATYSTTTSSYSNLASATLPGTSAPNSPTELMGYAFSKTEVTLSWQPNYEIETTSMILERAKSGEGVYAPIAVLNEYQDAFADKNLQAGTTYNYRLKAVNSVGSSPYVETLITTDPEVMVYNALAKWNKRLGGSGDDWLNTIIRTPDGGYLLGGRSLSGVSGDHSQPGLGGSDIWIVKLDAQGNKRWDKHYGGGSYDSVDEIVITADGGYLLAGGSSSGIGGDRSESLRGQGDYWILKIDANGNRQWDHRYGGSGQDALRSLIKTTDGGYLLGGFSASDANGDKSQPSQGGYDYWIVKVNASGVKQWDKRFGGSGDDELVSMVQNADGSYLLGGSSDSPVSGDQSQGPRSYEYSMDYWIVKINNAGTKVWDRRYGGDYGDYLSALIPTPDGGYLLGGSSQSGASGDRSEENKIQYASCGEPDYYNYSNWLVKINSSGVKQWDKAFMGEMSPGGKNDDFLTTLIPTQDGGYLLGSTSASRRGYDKSETSLGASELNNYCHSFSFYEYHSSFDYWIIKLGSNGSQEWDKSFGGYGSEVLSAVVQDTDGSFVLAGYSNSAAGGDKSQASQGLNDYWVVKTNPTSPVSLIRLNSAGPGVGSTLGNFSADWYFTGSSELITSARAIAGTTDDVLYYDYRQATTGNFGYNIPVNNGTYSVRLLFAETFYTEAGQRKFNVSAEGMSWLSNFDILADAGAAKKATIKSRLVTVKDGNLTLSFASVVGKAMVSAIEIVPATGGREGEALTDSAEGIRLQAYPNPFTTQVTLAFSVEQTDEVTLDVYDLQGALIKHLYQGKAEGGKTYEVTMGSETLRSGMYISRLTSTTQVANQKLVLVH